MSCFNSLELVLILPRNFKSLHFGSEMQRIVDHLPKSNPWPPNKISGISKHWASSHNHSLYIASYAVLFWIFVWRNIKERFSLFVCIRGRNFYGVAFDLPFRSDDIYNLIFILKQLLIYWEAISFLSWLNILYKNYLLLN